MSNEGNIESGEKDIFDDADFGVTDTQPQDYSPRVGAIANLKKQITNILFKRNVEKEIAKMKKENNIVSEETGGPSEQTKQEWPEQTVPSEPVMAHEETAVPVGQKEMGPVSYIPKPNVDYRKMLAYITGNTRTPLGALGLVAAAYVIWQDLPSHPALVLAILVACISSSMLVTKDNCNCH